MKNNKKINKVKGNSMTILLVMLGAIILFGGIGGCMYGMPKYKVYSQTMRGEADFKEAEINRQIRVEEARAEEEAMMLEANGSAQRNVILANSTAERTRIHANATQEAISKIGEGLKANPEYLRWQWIEEVSGSEGERIYIPTEAGMPILEAKK